MKKLQILVFCCIISYPIIAQRCDCFENLNFVQKHVEQNYPGYKDKVSVKNQENYLNFTAKLIKQSKQTLQIDSCANLINLWISFFRDGHIQLFGPNGPTHNQFLYPNRNFSRGDYQEYSVEYKKLSPQSNYIRIGTFSERYYSVIDSIFRKYEAELSTSPNLIVDLRGNEGGATFTYFPLLPYLYTDTIWHTGFDVLATKDNIEAYERQLNSPYMPEEQKPYIRANIESMKQHINSLLSLSPDYPQVVPNPKESPENVIILVDNNCGSTTEHFLFIALQSSKVILMGEPTIGMYDYGDMRGFNLPSIPFQLFCATNRSRRLNIQQGIDNIGIQVHVSLNRNKDWVMEAQMFLEDESHPLRKWWERKSKN